MELRVEPIALPEKVTFNYDEIQTALAEKLEELRTVVYTDDQIKDAKAERAKWNGLKKNLNDERIRFEKEYMAPFDDFKKKIRSLCDMIDSTVSGIDRQVKDYEARKKEEKADAISALWAEIEHPDWLDLGNIYNDRWLNTTYRLEQIEEELRAKCGQIIEDLLTIEELPEFSFEAKEEYKRTLNLAGAIREGQRLADIQKRKEEAKKAAEEAERLAAERRASEEATRAEEQAIAKGIDELKATVRPVGQWLRFECYLTVDQAKALKQYFKENGITFRPF